MSSTSSPKPTTTAKTADDRAPQFRYSTVMADDIERRWQQRWDDEQAFVAIGPGDAGFDPARKKFYCLDMFPYPSGAGLHVGHPEGYTASDIICRYRRLQGDNVLHPMGWDAFGLPAEQYAIQTGVHPAKTTRSAIDTFRRQLKRFGFSYDWSREFATIDEDYFKWTQWIWLQAYDAWFDGEIALARPIGELVAEFASGERPIRMNPQHPADEDDPSPDTTWDEWASIDADIRRRIVDSYRLAYLSTQTVNWCPKLGTALANEEVIDGRSERGGHPVLRKPLRQWMFRITAYADRLLADLENVSWPESTRTMQREWIGRSEGAEVDFAMTDPPVGCRPALRVYTTRPDTLFGATYMVVAPEHPIVAQMLADPRPDTDASRITAYVDEAIQRADVDRMMESKEKTGVATGFDAVNPATVARIPIWIADYVLMGYGHGAIMAVPAHDERDAEFAKAFGLPVITVVEPTETIDQDVVFTGSGRGVNSTNDAVSLDGVASDEAKIRIIDWLESSGLGRRRVNFRLRDWLFSRQRYWGEPFPVVFDEDGVHYPVSASHLPVQLPDLADYQPAESSEPIPLLGKAEDWVHTTAREAGVSADLLPPDTPVRRETNTMPGWAGSCWYYLRYCSPRADTRLVDESAEHYWMLSRRDGKATTRDDRFDSTVHHRGGVDLYIGGAEHAVLHLLYARFWHKLLFDLGEVSTPEPFGKLFHQGMITSYAFQRADKSLVPVSDVDEVEERFVERETGDEVARVVAKMSKSLKNVVNPDDMIAEFGADTFRLYEMYMGPLEATKPWNTRDMNGPFRFLQRVWRLFVDEETGGPSGRLTEDAPDAELERALHATIVGVGQDIEKIRLNTAIAKLIELTNAMIASAAPISRGLAEPFLVLLAPFAPHIAEELWSRIGHDDLIARAEWPRANTALLAQASVELPVQINGKVRSRITVDADAPEEAVRAAALADPRIAEMIAGKTVRRVVIVPKKIVNVICPG